MTDKILFVDDDQKVLNGISRQVGDSLNIELADDPHRALETLQRSGPFAVVVSDMRMPGLNGIQLLTKVKEQSPDTVRIMLTGYADLQATIEAVNSGNIYRFLSKPCPHDVLHRAIDDGIAQYRLVASERELLDGTLHGSIKVLSEMLSLVNPLAFGRTSQVQRIAVAIGEEMGIANLWDLKIATMLFPLGCVTVSQNALEHAMSGQPIPDEEAVAYAQHAAIASGMLEKIPRLESVARIVAYQNKCFDGSGTPDDDVSGTDIPIAARILKIASDFEITYKKLSSTANALKDLTTRKGVYDPSALAALRHALRNGLCQSSHRLVQIEELVSGMVLAADVRTQAGQLMVACGQPVTDSIRRRLGMLCEDGVIDTGFVIEQLGAVDESELAVL
ncbi:MAG: response regulator [Phycisphaera sp. RhM]|nr:response regulator [Phycisphaera sp. RhM]